MTWPESIAPFAAGMFIGALMRQFAGLSFCQIGMIGAALLVVSLALQLKEAGDVVRGLLGRRGDQ